MTQVEDMNFDECSQVWMARCKPFDEIVAVKHMDLEAVNCSLVSSGTTNPGKWDSSVPCKYEVSVADPCLLGSLTLLTYGAG